MADFMSNRDFHVPRVFTYVRIRDEDIIDVSPKSEKGAKPERLGTLRRAIK